MSDVFILGAGFSKAISCSMPTMDELSEEVLRKLGHSPFPIPETLYQFGSDIEAWMTYLTQSQPWLREEDHLRNKALAIEIRRHIGEIIHCCTAESMRTDPSAWLLSLIGHWHSQRSTVITLNYDTLVESASSKVPSETNPKISEYFTYPPYFSNVASRHQEGFGFAAGKLETFTYLKLHGSTNWYYSGTDSFYGETIFFEYAEPWGTSSTENENSTASYSGDKTPLIIPPVTDKLTYFNNETFRRLWQEASSAVRDANRVFIIGYSLPLSDLDMKFFLSYSQPVKATPIYIIDLKPEVADRCKLVLPECEVRDDFAGIPNAIENFVKKYQDLPRT